MKFVKNNYKIVLIFILSFIITMLSCIFFTNLVGDEMWNYGFGLSISQGMVIYRDFSCLQMPLYFFLCSLFISIFGWFLYSSYILYSVITGLIMVILYKLINKKAFLMIPLLLIMTVPSYNYLCVLFLLLIIYIYKYYDDSKYRDIMIAFIVGLTFITKQNAGIFLLVPCLYYSKNKIKSIMTFLLPLLFLSLYLFVNDALLQFIDYCFLGMMEFNGNKNFVLFFVVLEGLIFIYLIYMLIKSKFKNKEVAYILMFNLLIYPLIEVYHFIICFIPVMYLLLKYNKNKYISVFLSIYLFAFLFRISYIRYHSFYNYKDYMYMVGRKEMRDYLVYNESLVNKYDDYNKFYIVNNAFPFKLYLNEDINKYDLLLKGNMGYHGDERYIEGIDNICKRESCVFFVGEICLYCKGNQFSREIYDYVVNNYQMVESNGYLTVYVKGK